MALKTIANVVFFAQRASQPRSTILTQAQPLWGRSGGSAFLIWGRCVLTDKECKAAKPGEKPVKLFDAHGLHLLISTTGHKSWRLKYRIGGKEKQLAFGAYPAIRLADAREMRDQARKALGAGDDPALMFNTKAQRRASTVAPDRTFKSVALAWHSLQSEQWKPRHAKKVLESLERDLFKPLGKMDIGKIRARDVKEALQAVQARGAKEAAHRQLQRITSIYTFAIAEEWVDFNPASGVKPALKAFRNRKYPALLDVAKCGAFLRAFEGISAYPLTKLASRLMALTAARSGILRLAEPGEFEDLDGPNPIWRVPAEKMKLELKESEQEAYEFMYPLSRQAVEVAKAALAFSGKRKYLFASARHSHQPISDNALNVAYRRVVGWEGKHVPHGWRSSFSTIMNQRAADFDRPLDRPIIDLMLAHIPPGVEPLYNRAAYMPQRRAIAQEWADLICVDLVSVQELVDTRRTR